MLKTGVFKISIAALLLTLSMGWAHAQEQETASKAWTDYLQAETEEQLITAIRTLVSEGQDALDFLNEKVDTASSDELVDVTYFIATIISQGGPLRDRPVPLPEGLAEKLANLLETSDDIALHGNIANIAAASGSSMAAAAPGLLDLLRRTEDPGMRATVSVALGMIGEQALPLLHDELRNGKDDRVRGDIARIMAGTEMPDDVMAAIKELLESDNPEARESAMRALRDAGSAPDDAVIMAAIANLADARTDHDRMMAASALSEVAKGDARALSALSEALDRMTVGDHYRPMVARILALHSDDGVMALASKTRDAQGEAVADLVHTLFVYATNDPLVIDAFLQVMDSENAEDRQTAERGLVKIGKPAIPRIEAAIAETEDDNHHQSLRRTLDAIGN